MSWLEPDKIIIAYKDCMIAAVAIEMKVSVLKKLEMPLGINCILPQSLIDWRNNTESTFYAIDYAYYPLFDYLQFRVIRLTLSNNLTLSTIGILIIKDIDFDQSKQFKVSNYYCIQRFLLDFSP